jgi:hypothetical protein
MGRYLAIPLGDVPDGGQVVRRLDRGRLSDLPVESVLPSNALRTSVSRVEGLPGVAGVSPA